MANGQAPFSDIGKRARDLLYKDYNFDHKFSLSIPNSTGLGLIATGLKKDQIFVGDISTLYKSGNTTVDVKVDTYSNVSTKVTVNDILHGTKAALSFNIPDHKSGKFIHLIEIGCDQKSQIDKVSAPNHLVLRMMLSVFSLWGGVVERLSVILCHTWKQPLKLWSWWAVAAKLDVQYLHPHAAIDSSIGLNPSPLLELSAAIGSKDLSLGAEVGFNTTSASFTKYNAGVAFNKPDFSAALILADKGQTLKTSYIHHVDRPDEFTVAAEITHRFSTFENRFTIGSSQLIDPNTVLKTRFSDDGKAAFQCQRAWRPNSLITLSAEYDSTKIFSSSTKFGLALSLKP
ncbi:unnamed protein product [Sphenostylis stenocarpa]|uniref:Mitochondrial outer membrane protein porin 6 n=1 Tax=Sphenostylis stenocarpa TaxID=92480 RepID=A0AA86VXN5_9FABA|nr:unnamed protein product [Sphenostylis stenocarpa]